MAIIFPDFGNIARLTVPPTAGELALAHYLAAKLDDSFEIFFNAYLDGDRPDIIILKQGHGAVIIEVKDWNPVHYHIDTRNRWHVATSVNNAVLRSPHQQVFRYKTNMFELHLPLLGLKEAVNKAFFNVIDVYVYFHAADESALAALYNGPLRQLKDHKDQNNARFRNKEISFADYERISNDLNTKSSKLTRDHSISFTPDNIDKKMAKIKFSRPNVLFTDDIYQDFKRRLSPPENVLTQGIAINFDKTQSKFIASQSGLSKIKGIAGSGKTTILAKRAVNAHARHNHAVLVLTFNLTLKPFIRDKISLIRGGVEWQFFEITNYHQFFNACLNELNISIAEYIESLTHRGIKMQAVLEHLYKNGQFFEGQETRRYDTILIDEIQDYEPEWVEIVRTYFLAEAGEMVLFGDQSQNIYQRDDKKRESSIARGFGRWEKLTKSYRSKIDTPLINMFKNFQTGFLLGKYHDTEIFESEMVQGSMNFDLLQYETYEASDPVEMLSRKIKTTIRAHDLHPNDIVILCSSLEMLIKFHSDFGAQEKTMIMFETAQESIILRKQYPMEKAFIEARDKLRRRKKTFFMQNSGLVKISTTHSFKGMESKTAFILLMKDDDPELVYTAITRAKNNLIIFGLKESRYHKFFQQALDS